MNNHAATSIVFTVLTVVCAVADGQDFHLLDSPAHPAKSVSLNCDDLGPCGGGSAACACGGPRWTATVDALFLERRDSVDEVLGFSTVDPTQNLSANDLRFGSHTGVDLSLTRQFASGTAIELRYFGVDHWDANVNAATAPGDLFRVNAAVPVFTFSGDAIAAHYTSELQNAEINGRQQVSEWLELLAGFRYVGLDERGSASLINAAVPFDYSVTTRNRLYGGQIGAELHLWDANGPFSLDAIGKAGIFGNAADQDSSAATGLATLPASGRGDRTSFVGEIGITGTYWLSDALAVRTGYRTLWINRVALASDQLAESDFAAGTGITASGDVFYHGAFVGVELAH